MLLFSMPKYHFHCVLKFQIVHTEPLAVRSFETGSEGRGTEFTQEILAEDIT